MLIYIIDIRTLFCRLFLPYAFEIYFFPELQAIFDITLMQFLLFYIFIIKII